MEPDLMEPAWSYRNCALLQFANQYLLGYVLKTSLKYRKGELPARESRRERQRTSSACRENEVSNPLALMVADGSIRNRRLIACWQHGTPTRSLAHSHVPFNYSLAHLLSLFTRSIAQLLVQHTRLARDARFACSPYRPSK